jgi:hypothetical protein
MIHALVSDNHQRDILHQDIILSIKFAIYNYIYYNIINIHYIQTPSGLIII